MIPEFEEPYVQYCIEYSIEEGAEVWFSMSVH